MSASFTKRQDNILLAAWLIALIATLSALFIGEIMGQTPCLLCWYQRIFMFPLAIILGVGSYLSDAKIWRYALPLAAIGALIALYHTLLYIGVIPEGITPCTRTGPSCASADMTVFGSVPLPLLSLTAFSAIAGLLITTARRN